MIWSLAAMPEGKATVMALFEPLLPEVWVDPTSVMPAPELHDDVVNEAVDEVAPLPPAAEKTWYWYVRAQVSPLMTTECEVTALALPVENKNTEPELARST